MLSTLAKSLIERGQLKTTEAKAKEAGRLIDRLITLGKDGSVHARRQAYRVLQDRGLVKRLFADIAPRFLDCPGGYTRIIKLNHRRGDGASLALLELARIPVDMPASAHPVKTEAAPAPRAEDASKKSEGEPSKEKPKRFFEGLRGMFKKKGQRGA